MSDEELKRPEWMTSISANVKAEDYMLGRKVDKTFELSQQEKADKAHQARIELIANNRIKLSQDPILDQERRRQELKMELIRNPIKLRQFRERLLRMEREKLAKSGQEPSPLKQDRAPSDFTSDKCNSYESNQSKQQSTTSCDKRVSHDSRPREYPEPELGYPRQDRQYDDRKRPSRDRESRYQSISERHPGRDRQDHHSKSRRHVTHRRHRSRSSSSGRSRHRSGEKHRR